MTVEERCLRPDELGKWLDFLSEEVFPGDPRSAVEDIWLRDPEKDFGGVFIAVDGQGRILSSVMAGCMEISLCGGRVYAGVVSGVGTRREMRGRGLASRLFALSHARLLQKGARLAHLYSKADTLSFYRRLGYLERPRRPGEDFFRMYRVLAPMPVGGAWAEDTRALLRILDEKEP